MSLQTVLSCQREGSTLTLRLKRDLQNDPPVVAVIIVIIAFLFFLASSNWLDRCLMLFLMTVGGILIFRAAARIQTLRYTNTALFVEDEYRYVSLIYHRVFKREDCMLPISRVLTASGQYGNSFRWKRNFRYETWIPFAATGCRGTICRHADEEAMLKLENELNTFWTEVPCETEIPSEKIETSFDCREYNLQEYKSYTIDRGDDFPQHTVSEKVINVTYSIEENGEEKTLTLISEKGKWLSRTFAKISIFLYGWLSALLGVACLSIFGLVWYYWQAIDPQLTAFLQGEHFQQEILPKYVPNDLLDDAQKLGRDFGNVEPFHRMLYGFGMVFLVFCPIFIIFSILRNWFRWPFWKRWTVHLEHSRKRHRIITNDWQTDRHKEKYTRISFAPFFKAIPATAKTNRLLTGRSFFDLNPGWKQPLQVVILTTDRSIPFPVADAEEQERIIQVLTEFVKSVTRRT